jgi:hypothetical protein
MEAEVAEEHGSHSTGWRRVTKIASEIRPERVRTPSSPARLDSRWRLSLTRHVARELYYFSFCPATIVIRIAVASANKCAVSAVG